MSSANSNLYKLGVITIEGEYVHSAGFVEFFWIIVGFSALLASVLKVVLLKKPVHEINEPEHQQQKP